MKDQLSKQLETGAQWVIGFMSGTSLDGVDAALIRTDGDKVLEFGDWLTLPFSHDQRELLSSAVDEARVWNWNGAYPQVFSAASDLLVRSHAEAAGKLLGNWTGPPPILAGFHGQTVLHRRPGRGLPGATLQLGDASLLARELQLPVVSDLRRADIDAGGEGAPVAPVYHMALLDRFTPSGVGVVLNIGGVANFTWRQDDGDPIAFDTGPGNGPIDQWVKTHNAGEFDRGGRIARDGRISEARIFEWFKHPHFDAQPPKSLDRYDFSADKLVEGMSLEDGVATLTEFTARTILLGVSQMPAAPDIVVATGGGRHNRLLMSRLRDVLGDVLVQPELLGWRGDAIEAEAFAFLAARSVRGLPNTYPTTTGAPRPLSGGRLNLPEGWH